MKLLKKKKVPPFHHPSSNFSPSLPSLAAGMVGIGAVVGGGVGGWVGAGTIKARTKQIIQNLNTKPVV